MLPINDDLCSEVKPIILD